MKLQELYNHRKPKKLLDQVRDVMRVRRTFCRHALISATSKALSVINDMSTNMVYNYVLRPGGNGVKSPFDMLE